MRMSAGACRRRARWHLAIAVVMMVTAVASGCAAVSDPTHDQAERGPLTVFAAASLTESFEQARAAMGPGFGSPIRYSFSGSQVLAAQIEQAAPADVFASADDTTMLRLRRSGLVEEPQALARNRLTIAVARGNPKGVVDLADLARRDLAVVLVDASAPAGRYSRAVLSRAGVSVRPRSEEIDVRSAVARVARGEADATIAYVTDARRPGDRVDEVQLPDALNVTASYSVAVVAGTPRPGSARRFVRSAVDGSLHRSLLANGFLPA